jgi:hypothetical protein
VVRKCEVNKDGWMTQESTGLDTAGKIETGQNET